MSNRKPRAPTVTKAEASAQTSVAVRPLVTQPHGGALIPGGTGAGGRPKEVWRRQVREALQRADGVEFLVRVVKGEVKDQERDEHGAIIDAPLKVRDRITAANILIEQAHGKPPQDVTIDEPAARQTGEEVMARVMRLLPQVIAVLPVDRKEIARLLEQRRAVEVLMSGQQAKDGRTGNGDGARTSSIR